MYSDVSGIYDKYCVIRSLCDFVVLSLNACTHAQGFIQVLYNTPGGYAGFQHFINVHSLQYDSKLFYLLHMKFGFLFSGGLDPAADSKISSQTLCPERPQLHLFQ